MRVEEVCRREHEHLADHVRLLLVAAHEPHHLTAGRILYHGDETRAHDLLKRHPLLGPRPRDVETSRAERKRQSHWAPLDNPANDRVLTARVMAVSDRQLWMQAADGTLHRPWAPPTGGLAVPTGTEVEMYFDASGALNGWYDPRSGLAINQRCLNPEQPPTAYSDLLCQGRCGLMWHAPAAARLTERQQRCLTCAGPLVPR